MSINSNMKFYEIYNIIPSENSLGEKVNKVGKFKDALVSIHEKAVNLLDNNNIYRKEMVLVALTRDNSIKEAMVIKINDKLYNIKHIKNAKRIISMQLEEAIYD